MLLRWVLAIVLGVVVTRVVIVLRFQSLEVGSDVCDWRILSSYGFFIYVKRAVKGTKETERNPWA